MHAVGVNLESINYVKHIFSENEGRFDPNYNISE